MNTLAIIGLIYFLIGVSYSIYTVYRDRVYKLSRWGRIGALVLSLFVWPIILGMELGVCLLITGTADDVKKNGL